MFGHENEVLHLAAAARQPVHEWAISREWDAARKDLYLRGVRLAEVLSQCVCARALTRTPAAPTHALITPRWRICECGCVPLGGQAVLHVDTCLAASRIGRYGPRCTCESINMIFNRIFTLGLPKLAAIQVSWRPWLLFALLFAPALLLLCRAAARHKRSLTPREGGRLRQPHHLEKQPSAVHLLSRRASEEFLSPVSPAAELEALPPRAVKAVSFSEPPPVVVKALSATYISNANFI